MQLDREQQSCVDAPLGPLSIIAGPGAGKTRTVVARIAGLVNRGEVRSDKVLALTHTTKAAGELKDRLAAAGVVGVHVSTVHAMALKQLKRFAPLLEQSVPNLVSSNFGLVKDAAQEVLGNVDTAVVSELCGEIDWASASLVPPGKYGIFAGRAGREISIEAPQVDMIRERYIVRKKKAGVIDFSDVLALALAQMSDERVKTAVRGAFGAIFVDEYQDIDPLQQAVIDGWLDGRDVLCVCGDPDQGVFSFKGGDPGLLLGFKKKFPHAREITLVKNYRSSSEVVSWVNKIALHKKIALDAVRKMAGVNPVALFIDTEEQEEKELVEQLRAWKRSGVPFNEMAVLYRYNAISARLEAALTSARIPYNVAGSQKFFERRDVREVLVPFGQKARVEPEEDGLVLLTDAAGEAGWDVNEVPEGMGAARQRYDAITALIDLAAERYGGLSAKEMLAALQERAREAHDPTPGGVALATVHAAKGLEWEAVWVAGAVEGVMPSSYAETKQQLDEERHLFYVAISRAKTHLVVSAAKKRHNNFNDRPSRFFDLLGVGVVNQARKGGQVKKQPPPMHERQCAACGKRLVGAPGIMSGRCSGPCLDGENRRVYDALAVWRDTHAAKLGQGAATIATDKALFAMAVKRSSSGVTGLGVPASDVPTALFKS